MSEIEISRQPRQDRQDQRRKEQLYLMWCIATHRTVLTAASSLTLGFIAGKTVRRLSDLESRVRQLEYDTESLMLRDG